MLIIGDQGKKFALNHAQISMHIVGAIIFVHLASYFWPTFDIESRRPKAKTFYVGHV
jgi:hypothetical protein